jgi:DNA-binding SARP family transcriptional activator/DNA-binding beta-propeller fold protein YncE
MSVRISLLGPLEATVDGAAVELGSPQQRAILALLALRTGSVVSVDALIDVLWPSVPPPTATKVVQTYISRLRKSLGDETIARRGRGYLLNLDPSSVDAIQFEELVHRGRHDEALALWRGSALQDLAESDGLRHEAQRLEELRLRAIEAQVDEQLANGSAEAVLADLRALVAAHPLRERLVGRLMLALYASGRQAEALEVYRDERKALVDDLGIEPGAELRELERRILAQDPELAPVGTPAGQPSEEAQVARSRQFRLVAVAIAAIAAAAVAVAFALDRGAHAVTIRPNTILRIDPSTNKVVESIRVGREPSGIAATESAVWVANERDRTLSRYDIRTHEIQTIGGLAGVGFVTRDEHGNIYASGWDYPYVWRVDPRKVEVIARYRVHSRAVGMAVGGGSLWVVDRLIDAATRIDLARGKVAGSIPVGLDPLVCAFGFGALWVANSDNATVSVVRPGVPKPETIAVGARPFGIAAGEGGVWVGSNSASTVTRIDPELGRVVKTIDTGATEEGLYNVAAGAGGVWAADTSGLQIIRIDPRSNRVAARIKLGVQPRVIAIAGNSVWVSVAKPGAN